MANICDESKTTIHTLPLDILYAIFISIDSEPHFSIVLSHCCSRWRHFAISTPSLWTTISFVNPRERMLRKGGALVQVGSPDFAKQRAYLARSQNLLIDIAVGYESPTFGPNLRSDCFISFGPKGLSRIMGILLPHINRCKSFKVRAIPHKGCRAIFDRLSMLDAPNLESLEAEIPPVGESCQWRLVPFKQGRGAPRLKNLKVGYGMGVNQWKGSLFSSLTTLTLSNYENHDRSYYTSIMFVLSCNPGLRSLTLSIGIGFDYGNPFHPFSSTPLTLPYLHTMRLYSYGDLDPIGDPSEMTLFLLSLDVPALTTLEQPLFLNKSIKMLASMPSLSFTRLQELSVCNLERTKDLYNIIVQLQNLRCLTIIDYFNTSDSHDWDQHLIQPLSTMFPDLLKVGIIKYRSWREQHDDTFKPIDLFRRIYATRSLVPYLSNIEILDVGRRNVSEEDLTWLKDQKVHLVHEPASPTVRSSRLARKSSRARRRAYMARVRRARGFSERVTEAALEGYPAVEWDEPAVLDWSAPPDSSQSHANVSWG